MPQSPRVFLAALAIALSLTLPTCKPAIAPSDGDNQQVLNRGEGKDQWWDALPRPAWSRYRLVSGRDAWFEVYEILDGLYAIYEPGQFEEVISYLIEGSERAVLFDTGLGVGDMRSVVANLTDKEIWVLNSHTHYDHVGGNHQFQNIYGTRTSYTSTNSRGRAHEEVSEFVGEGWIWKPTPPEFSGESYQSKPFSVTEFVDDGQILDLGGIQLEVLLTPGHAPDSLCLLDRKRRLLFTGDTFYPATLYAHLDGSRFDEYYETAQRLASLSPAVEQVLPAHNEPFMSGEMLVALGRAFDEIQTPEADYVLTDGNLEYDFGQFSVLVSEPPPWNGKLP